MSGNPLVFEMQTEAPSYRVMANAGHQVMWGNLAELRRPGRTPMEVLTERLGDANPGHAGIVLNYFGG